MAVLARGHPRVDWKREARNRKSRLDRVRRALESVIAAKVRVFSAKRFAHKHLRLSIGHSGGATVLKNAHFFSGGIFYWGFEPKRPIRVLNRAQTGLKQGSNAAQPVRILHFGDVEVSIISSETTGPCSGLRIAACTARAHCFVPL